MTRVDLLSSLQKPTISGRAAIFWMFCVVTVPTLIRMAASNFVSGCELTIYLPFVLIAAMFLGWRYATATALSSAVVAEVVIMGRHHGEFMNACDMYAVIVLLVSSAAIISVVETFRSLIASRLDARMFVRRSNGGIVFSLEEGEAWASWYGQPSPVHLGPESEVARMMEDFLAQRELGRRLADRTRR